MTAPAPWPAPPAHRLDANDLDAAADDAFTLATDAAHRAWVKAHEAHPDCPDCTLGKGTLLPGPKHSTVHAGHCSCSGCY